MRDQRCAIVLLLLVSATLLQAQGPFDQKKVPAAKDRPAPVEQEGKRQLDAADAAGDVGQDAQLTAKREWLRRILVDPIRSKRKRDLYSARLDRMTTTQVDQLVNHYQNLAEQQRRQRLAAANRNRFGPPVGFSPVITWLPSGTNLGVGAVVSPDRRSVRTSINPVFSNVPYYDTFNMRNGNTRRYPVNPPQAAASTPRSSRTTATPAPPSRSNPSWYRRVRGR